MERTDMPRRDDILKVLIIGSGPTIIGQSGEFDYAAAQACAALRSQGIETIAVDADPATLLTDRDTADAAYLEPLNAASLAEIIRLERPDALLPVVSGQSGIRLAVELVRDNTLDAHGVKLLGTSFSAIELIKNRTAFKVRMAELGIQTPESRIVGTLDDAEKIADAMGCPLVVHPAYTLGGTGGGMVYNMEEFSGIVRRGLSESLVNQVMIEESVQGLAEFELVMLSDVEGRVVTVSAIENVDPTGVHTGDSIAVTPMMTVSTDVGARLEASARKVMSALGLIGTATIQFAHDPETDRILIIEVNPRTSRASAFASKATGVPVAYVAALLALGLTLDEIPMKGGTLKAYRPEALPVAVRYPRWAFADFVEVEDRLGIQMQSIGEAMGLGGTFKEALQKALRSLNTGCCGFGSVEGFDAKPLDDLLNLLGTPSSKRPFVMYEALRKGADVKTVAAKTRIRPWFVEQMADLAAIEARVMQCRDAAAGAPRIDDDLLIQAKQNGFSDRYLARILSMDEREIRERRMSCGCVPAWAHVDAKGLYSPGFAYTTYNAAHSLPEAETGGMMMLGGGPYSIGQGIQFDHSTVHALKALRSAGLRSVMVNSNPAAGSTDDRMSDRLYIEPLTVEDILNVVEREKPVQVLVQFSGKSTDRIAGELRKAGVPIVGSGSGQHPMDRPRILEMLKTLGIPHPKSETAETAAAAEAVGAKIGYPLRIRNGGAAAPFVRIIRDAASLHSWATEYFRAFKGSRVEMEACLEKGIEVEACALSDGTAALMPTLVEDIEPAGVHAGDSASVIPPISIAPKHIETMKAYAQRIAEASRIRGIFHIRFAISEDTVYVLDVRDRVSRTLPLISKVVDMPMAAMAVRLMLGTSLAELSLPSRTIPYYGVKESVFPFDVFPEMDPLPGAEMRSTGEVATFSTSFGLAFFKSQEAATRTTLPLEGSVLVTVADKDKPGILEPVRLFRDMGFAILATTGTRQFLGENGIAAELIKKLGYGRPDIVDAVKNGRIDLVINTALGRQSQEDDSYIRKASLKYRVPNLTTAAAALAAARGIAARRQGSPEIKPLAAYYDSIGQAPIA